MLRKHSFWRMKTASVSRVSRGSCAGAYGEDFGGRMGGAVDGSFSYAKLVRDLRPGKPLRAESGNP